MLAEEEFSDLSSLLSRLVFVFIHLDGTEYCQAATVVCSLAAVELLYQQQVESRQGVVINRHCATTRRYSS